MKSNTRQAVPFMLVIAVLLAAFWLRAAHYADWPPGLSTDEANNANDALRLARTGVLPLYAPDNRPEPLFRVVQAGFILLIGPTTFGFRVASLFTGVLSVAAAYRAGRHFSRVHPGWAGLLAAGCLAVMIGHIHLSRVGERAMPQALAMLLFFDAFISGWRLASVKRLALAGLWAAVAVLSYTAGLIMPLVMGFAVAYQLIIGRQALSPAIRRGLAAMIAAFALGVSPLVVMGFVQPNLYARAAEVQGGANRTPTERALFYAERIEVTWRMFYREGDKNPQYNTASAPLMTTQPLYWLLLIGIGWAAWRWRSLPHALALGMLFASLLPVAVADEIPHGLRIMGAFAAAPLIAAAAGEALPGLGKRLTLWWGLLIAVVLLHAGFQAYRIQQDYFTGDPRWGDGGAINAFSWFQETRRQRLAQYIAAADEPLYLPLRDAQHSAMRYFTAQTHPRVTTWAAYFPADAPTIDLPAGTFLFPVGHQSQQTAYAMFTPQGEMVLLPHLNSDAIDSRSTGQGGPLYDAQGELAGQTLRVTEGISVPRQPQHISTIDYAGGIRLVGWDGPAQIEPGRPLQVTLYFGPGQGRRRDVAAFAQLWDWDNNLIAASSEQTLHRWLYPPDQWQADDIVPWVVELDPPAESAPGAYGLMVGLRGYRLDLLPVLGADGAPVAELGRAGRLRAPGWPPPRPPQAPIQPPTIFADEVILNGYSLAGEVQPGETISLTLVWGATFSQAQADYTAFVHVLDGAGQLIAQSDVAPGGVRYPSGVWAPGEAVESVHMISIPAEAQPPLSLYTGLYSWPDLTRLAITEGEFAGQDRLLLTP